jgi:hypothetical protein
MMRKDSERILKGIVTGNQSHCSGIDWVAVTREIVQRHASDLINFRDVLRELPSLKNYTTIRNWMVTVREQTHVFLLPYLEYVAADQEDSWLRRSKFGNDTFSRCKYHHTRLLVPEEGVFLNSEEKTMQWAVDETMGAICEVFVSVGFSVETIWSQDFNQQQSHPGKKWQWDKTRLLETQRWKDGIEELMAWLGWADAWVRCDKTCAWDEKCYIPIWPLMGRRGFGRPPGGDGRRPSYGYPGAQPGGGYGYPPGYGFRPGYGRRGPGGPGFGMQDDTDLWEPKCVKAEYIMG